MRPAVAQLLHNPLLWRGDAKARVERTVATGFAELDRELPGGGWPQGSPYDAIVLEGATETPPETFLPQIKEGGRLVCVLGGGPASITVTGVTPPLSSSKSCVMPSFLPISPRI